MCVTSANAVLAPASYELTSNKNKRCISTLTILRRLLAVDFGAQQTAHWSLDLTKVLAFDVPPFHPT